MTVTLGSTYATDSTGWTSFTYPGSGNVYYVSKEAGASDSNNGTSVATPFLTAAHAMAVLNALPSNAAYWLLFREGDVWTEVLGQIKISGAGDGTGAGNPLVIGSYDPSTPQVVSPGTFGVRPQFKVTAAQVATAGAACIAFGAGGGGAGGNYTALIGLDFYCYDRDPGNAGFSSTAASDGNGIGVWIENPITWFLIEGCWVHFFGADGIVFEGASINKVIIRRNLVTDQYAVSGLSSGMYLQTTANPIIEENIFDHNGWNATVTNANNPTYTERNHNFYIAGFEPDGLNGGTHDVTSLSPIQCFGNISCNDNSGIQARSGGTITNNLFFNCEYPTNFGAPNASATYLCNENVCLSPAAPGTGNPCSFGTMGATYNSDNYNAGVITFDNNISANSSVVTTGSITVLTGFTNQVVTNNITYSWGSDLNDAGTGTVKSGNVANGTDPGFPDPTHATVADYYTSIGNPGSFPSTTAGFVSALRTQRKGSWDSRLTAHDANNFIRGKFGMVSYPITARGGHGKSLKQGF